MAQATTNDLRTGNIHTHKYVMSANGTLACKKCGHKWSL